MWFHFSIIGLHNFVHSKDMNLGMDWHVQACIGAQVFMRDPLSWWNVSTWVICGLNGGFIGDRQIPSDYVVIVVREVFIENAIIAYPFNINVDNAPRTIFFWSCKFLKHDM